MSAADYGLEGGAGEGSATTSLPALPLPPSPSLTTSSATPSTILASVPAASLREDQVSNAVSFLVHPKVRRWFARGP